MRHLLLAVTAALLFFLTPAPAAAQTEPPPTTAPTTGNDDSGTSGGGYHDRTRDEARAEAEREGETPGGSQPGRPVDLAARWTRLCGNAGIGAYDPNRASEFSVQIERVRDAQGTYTEAFYTEYRHGTSPGALTIGELGTITVSGSNFGQYWVTCRNGERVSIVFRIFADGPEVSPTQLRERALAILQIPRPEPGGSPPLTERFSVVNIPTWFWVENWTDDGLTESASDGGTSVSVTATPVAALWDPGDGTTPFICDSGVAWTSGLNEDDTTCSHTYKRSTAGQPGDALTISTTLTWELSWSLNGTDQGVFATLDNTTNTIHQVGEIQVRNVTNR